MCLPAGLGLPLHAAQFTCTRSTPMMEPEAFFRGKASSLSPPRSWGQDLDGDGKKGGRRPKLLLPEVAPA